MPIYNIQGCCQLEFGRGDIRVGHSLLPKIEEEDPAMGVVAFWSGEPTEIGVVTTFDEPRELAVSQTRTRLVFSRVESIDVLVRHLLATKQAMLTGEIKPINEEKGK